jgi:hypothetical protein
MKEQFRDIHLSKANLSRLDIINQIIENYQADGYRLTLRQLYYQLVSRDIIPNKQAEYAKLSNLLKEGRMAGIVDWDAIEDRLRRPDVPSSWESPKHIVQACIEQYRVNRMRNQSTYIEVWVEKDALSGVLKRVTEKYHIPIVVNRGYSSATAMHDAHMRFASVPETTEQILIIYIGDFDPSGQDMIRDITDRIDEFNNDSYYDFKVAPIALLRSQIQAYNPPPNPAKITDPRAKEYIRKYGPTSWEVDALRPEILHSLLEDEILNHIDMEQYENALVKEKEGKSKLSSLVKKL